MRKTDYMSKWKMGIGSAFLMVMLAGCGSGMQDLASVRGLSICELRGSGCFFRSVQQP